MSRPKKLLLISSPLALLFIALLFMGVFSPRAGASFNVTNYTNHLIDDIVFTNSSSMSAAQIQTFLQNEGSGLASFQDFVDCSSNPSFMANYYPCGQNAPASSIIYDAGQAYGISPRAIMATLQKEQSLITTPNPAASQLNYAMGYGCPDSTGCGGNSHPGFFQQVDWGTWQLRLNVELMSGRSYFGISPSSYACNGPTRYYSQALKPGNDVHFYDDNGTDYNHFVIADASTASLYCYTPHAYNNPHGQFSLPTYGTTGLYYSGSYNFVYYFNLWWGSTIGPFTTTGLTVIPSNPVVGQPVEVKFTITNYGTTDVGVGGMIVGVRDPSGKNKDYAFANNVIVPANGTYTYDQSQVFSVPGSYQMFISNFGAGQWWSNYPASATASVSQQATVNVGPNPLVTTGLSLSPSNPVVGEPVTASFTITNYSNTTVGVGDMIVAVRDPSGVNKDYALDSNVLIPGNGTYTYSMPQVFTRPGAYRIFISNFGAGQWWSNYPASANSSIAQQASFNVGPNPLITTGLSLSPTNPVAGQPVTASFTIANYGHVPIGVGGMIVAVRDPNGNNKDFAFADNVIIPANGTYTYSSPQTFTQAGKYQMFISNFGGGNWYQNYPASASSAIVQQASVTVGH